VKRADIIVVGAGLVGLTTALALREAGFRPLVLEGGDEDAPAMSILPPWRLPAIIQDMAQRHAAQMPELVVRLGQLTGVDCEFRRDGLVLIGDQADGGQAWLNANKSFWQWGQVASFEPALTGAELDAMLLTGMTRVRASRLARALRLALPRWQVPVVSGRPVARLQVAGNIVLGVELADGLMVEAESVVLAAGSRSNALLFDSGLDPVRIDSPPVAHLLFNPGQRLISHAINTGDCCLLPYPDGRILAADLMARDCEAEQAVDDLLERVGNWLPALSRFDLEASGLGPRPGLGEDLPAIGAYPQMRALWINGGHARRGLEISLAAGECLADQLDGGAVPKSLAVRLADG
jgi:glycine/D-amino acid oxidase-like deaminating enzyme